MKRKPLRILLIVLIVILVSAIGFVGFLYYKDNYPYPILQGKISNETVSKITVQAYSLDEVVLEPDTTQYRLAIALADDVKVYSPPHLVLNIPKPRQYGDIFHGKIFFYMKDGSQHVIEVIPVYTIEERDFYYIHIDEKRYDLKAYGSYREFEYLIRRNTGHMKK